MASILDIKMQKNKLFPRALALTLALVLNVPLAQADCLGMALHAHRGSNDAPENSLLAVKRAFEGQWDGAEIDIQHLRDQTWVLHHDLQLGRTTTLQQRRVADLDSNAWKEVRLRDRRGVVGNEQAPFLTDVLAQVADDEVKVMNVEIKEWNNGCMAAQQAVRTLAEGRPNGRWFMTSIDRAQLQCVRQVDPQGYVGLIVLDPKALAEQSRFSRMGKNIPPKLIDAAWLARLRQDVGLPVGVHVDVATLAANPSLLADAKAIGVAVFTYSLNSDREHAEGLRKAALRTRLLPSGAIIDGAPDQFCSSLGYL
jgi:glycerophosphoryl diester phosphodiesterase